MDQIEDEWNEDGEEEEEEEEEDMSAQHWFGDNSSFTSLPLRDEDICRENYFDQFPLVAEADDIEGEGTESDGVQDGVDSAEAERETVGNEHTKTFGDSLRRKELVHQLDTQLGSIWQDMHGHWKEEEENGKNTRHIGKSDCGSRNEWIPALISASQKEPKLLRVIRRGGWQPIKVDAPTEYHPAPELQTLRPKVRHIEPVLPPMQDRVSIHVDNNAAAPNRKNVRKHVRHKPQREPFMPMNTFVRNAVTQTVVDEHAQQVNALAKIWKRQRTQWGGGRFPPNKQEVASRRSRHVLARKISPRHQPVKKPRRPHGSGPRRRPLPYEKRSRGPRHLFMRE